MKLKKIIKDVCVTLGLDELALGLDAENISQATETGTKKFVNYFNVIEKEIASEFLPAMKKEYIEAENQIDFSSLEEDILDVIYIKNKDNQKMFFEVFPSFVTFQGTSFEILYTYLPDDFGLTDDIDVLVPNQVYVYGILREQYENEGLLDKAQICEEKFKNSISSLIEKDKNKIFNPKRLPKRNWF